MICELAEAEEVLLSLNDELEPADFVPATAALDNDVAWLAVGWLADEDDVDDDDDDDEGEETEDDLWYDWFEYDEAG